MKKRKIKKLQQDFVGVNWSKVSLPPLTREEEQELIPRAQEGDEQAKEMVIRSNVRFVMQTAHKLFSQCSISPEDLFSEGVIGLQIALERFDPKRGMKFISYAVWWVRQRMMTAVYLDRVVHRPSNLNLLHRKYIQKQKELLEQGLKPHQIDIFEALDWSEAKREGLRSYQATDISLDGIYYEDGERVHCDDLLDVVARAEVEEEPVDILGELQGEGLGSEVQRQLANLDERSAYVITTYFGLGGEPPQTLDQIGRTLSLTRERVRQIKAEVLSKFQKKSSLRNYYE